jgi:hypothetical protein
MGGGGGEGTNKPKTHLKKKTLKKGAKIILI